MKVIIPLSQIGRPTSPLAPTQAVMQPTANLLDQRQRPLRDLRISVTDRCNFRCTYCMPKAIFDKDYRYLPQGALLSFEEITTVVKAAIQLGVEKIRITGGEPLLRKEIEKLIEQLAQLHAVSQQPLDIALTTNGSLLRKKAQALKAAGLNRLTVSLDALDERVFQQMNDVDFPVEQVLDGITAATEAGFNALKINMVVQRGVNDQQILPMVRHFRGSPHILRFIEYMDVGNSNGWMAPQVMTSREILTQIQSTYPLTPLSANYSGEVAERWAYADGTGEIGFISSVSHAFCGSCTRARLSTEGQLFTCLFASHGHDLRRLLRPSSTALEASATQQQLATAIAHIWQARTDRYSETRFTKQEQKHGKKVEMSYIGG